MHHSLDNGQQKKSSLEALLPVRECGNNKVLLYFPFLCLPASRAMILTSIPKVGGEVPPPASSSTQSSQYLERISDSTGEGLSSVPQGCYVQHQTCMVTCASLTGRRLKVPNTPFLGSLNLLEQLTELTETLYLLDDRFTIKRC